MAAATGVHPDTVGRGYGRRKAAGAAGAGARGGRKKLAVTDPGLGPALMALVEPESRGDPSSPLRWTCRSTRNLAGTLTAAGHALLGADGRPAAARPRATACRGTPRSPRAAQHPDRDAQFRYIARQAREYLDAGQPVGSVDAKKKEKIGNFANGGAEWRPQGHPEPVNVHDFPSDAIGKAIPDGTTTSAPTPGG